MSNRIHNMTMMIVTMLVMTAGSSSVMPVQAAPKIDVPYYISLRQENKGQMVEKLTFIPTTDTAVSFAFGGFTRSDSLDYILDLMDQNGLKGTFFVTERELRVNSDNISKIVAHGQELGVGLRPSEGDRFVDYAAQIDRIRHKINQTYGINTNLVRQMYGPESNELKEAVAATHCILIGQTINVIQTKYKDMDSPEQVMPLLFKRWATSLGRGQIAYIRTDFTTKGTLPGDMMMAIKKNKIDNISYHSFDDDPTVSPGSESAYRVDTIGDILGNTSCLWKYPVDPQTLPRELQPGYVPVTVTDKNFNSEFYKRYVGSPDVTADDRMLGFNRSQMVKADKSGIVKSVTDNTIFLTFDDWGNDNSINKLLYVLKSITSTVHFLSLRGVCRQIPIYCEPLLWTATK